mgnify:FL=1
MEQVANEYVVRGYRITSEGERSTQLKERDWGDPGTHLLLVALTAWWSLGLLNALYAIYRYVTAAEVRVKVAEGTNEVEPDER